MSRRRRFFALVIAIILLMPLHTVFADEKPPELTDSGDMFTTQINASAAGIMSDDESSRETVGSDEDFENWLDNHLSGGSVSLENNVTLKKDYFLSAPIYIDAGVYGLTLDGGFIHGSLSITGEGVVNPVLTINNAFLWEVLLPSYYITALGSGDGEGGVAVHVNAEQSSGKPDFVEERGLIRSEGAGAVGIRFTKPANVHFLSISVEGEQSAAISAPSGADLYYGKLEASGESSKIVLDGDVLLDTCGITGDSSGADVVDRKIVSLAGSWLYWPLSQGQRLRSSQFYNIFYTSSKFSFLLSGNDAHPAEVRKIYALWDTDELSAIDTSIIGETIVAGKLLDVYQGLGLEDDFSLDLTVDIRDGSKPCILSVSFWTDVEDGRALVSFIASAYGFDFNPEEDGFVLWRSDNEGISWYNFTDSPDISLINGYISYYYDKIDSPVWFCLQDAAGEYSNIAAVLGNESKSYGLSGGDRIGVDRDGETTKPAPEPTPKPTPEAESAITPPSYQDERSNPDIQTHTDISSPPPAKIPDLDKAAEPVPEKSSPVATPPDEWENDTTIAVSGRRLSMMMGAGGGVTFIKNGVSLTFATSGLEKLGIDDNQIFSVKIDKLEPLLYMASAELDGEELYGLPCVATLDGNKRDISISGICDFTQPAGKPDAIPVQANPTHLEATQPSQALTGGEKAKQAAYPEEKASPFPALVFALLGIGCAVGAPVFINFRVKKHDG